VAKRRVGVLATPIFTALLFEKKAAGHGGLLSFKEKQL
jgi:hypothetical protein